MAEQAALSSSEIPKPRDRILQAAANLFYKKGIRAVSVDEIASEASTNKMTLYRHFASKDLLVAEYLRGLARRSDSVFAEAAVAHPRDAYAQLRTLIGRVGEILCGAGDRGCALANAAVEIPEKDHPARAVIEEHKTHQRERLQQLCKDAGFVEPQRVADELFLLLEGARINMQCAGPCGPGARFAAMATDLIKRNPRRK